MSVATTDNSVFMSVPAGTSAADIREIQRLFPNAQLKIEPLVIAIHAYIER